MERSGVIHNIITCLVEHAEDILNKVAVEPTGEPHMKAPQGKSTISPRRSSAEVSCTKYLANPRED